MNVYDFDGTIYDGDSSVDFYKFCVKINPLLLRYAPIQIFGAMLYCIKRIDKTKFKEYFFYFLHGIDTEKAVALFWKKYQYKIQKWYLSQKQNDDIIISASPEFLLKPICEKYGISHILASNIDETTGKFYGKNCKGEEKVKRLFEEYSVTHIDNFYSDSVSDKPLADIADKAFLVSYGVVKEWKQS